MNSTIKKVFGPPGSGKTTYLLNVVDQELDAGVSTGIFSSTNLVDYAQKIIPFHNIMSKIMT